MITTDLNYPPELPHPQRPGHEMRAVAPFMRTEMTSGRARQRRKFTSVPVIATLNFLFTDVEARLFERWFASTINDGADWFNIDVKTPLGMSSLVCRFASMYRGPNLFGVSHWTIGAEFEVFERTLMPPGWEILPGFVLRPDIFDIAMNKNWPKA